MRTSWSRVPISGYLSCVLPDHPINVRTMINVRMITFQASSKHQNHQRTDQLIASDSCHSIMRRSWGPFFSARHRLHPQCSHSRVDLLTMILLRLPEGPSFLSTIVLGVRRDNNPLDGRSGAPSGPQTRKQNVTMTRVCPPSPPQTTLLLGSPHHCHPDETRAGKLDANCQFERVKIACL
jgi:hypothetical protein